MQIKPRNLEKRIAKDYLQSKGDYLFWYNKKINYQNRTTLWKTVSLHFIRTRFLNIASVFSPPSVVMGFFLAETKNPDEESFIICDLPLKKIPHKNIRICFQGSVHKSTANVLYYSFPGNLSYSYKILAVFGAVVSLPFFAFLLMSYFSSTAIKSRKMV
jgi:hypothetical protein